MLNYNSSGSLGNLCRSILGSIIDYDDCVGISACLDDCAADKSFFVIDRHYHQDTATVAAS